MTEQNNELKTLVHAYMTALRGNNENIFADVNIKLTTYINGRFQNHGESSETLFHWCDDSPNHEDDYETIHKHFAQLMKEQEIVHILDHLNAALATQRKHTLNKTKQGKDSSTGLVFTKLSSVVPNWWKFEYEINGGDTCEAYGETPFTAINCVLRTLTQK